jgi:electron transport complex protein RnfC
VIVPIGTKIADLLAFVGVEEEYSKVLYGGPMMGFPVASLDQSILKNTNGIVVLKGRAARSPEPTACIRCGRCIDACPMGLSPLKMERAVLRKDGEALNGLSLASCMECGCCAYGCPAKRPLVQAFRLGKQMLREMKK